MDADMSPGEQAICIVGWRYLSRVMRLLWLEAVDMVPIKLLSHIDAYIL